MPLLIMASMFLLNKAHLYTDLHTHQKKMFSQHGWGSTFGTETIHAKILLNSKPPINAPSRQADSESPYITHPIPQVIIKDILT